MFSSNAKFVIWTHFFEETQFLYAFHLLKFIIFHYISPSELLHLNFEETPVNLNPMFRNYFKTGLRFLKKNKLFAGINLFGLSISLATSFIILLFVINELSYDHCHKNRGRIFRVLNFYPDIKNTVSSTPYILGSVLKEKFPQIEKTIRIMPIQLTFKTENGAISETAISTDSDVFDIFTLQLVEGSPKNNLLEDINSIVISRELAGKLFGRKNAVGKEIGATINDKDQLFTVRGVLKIFLKIPPSGHNVY